MTVPDDKGVHIKSADAKGEKYVYKYGNPRNLDSREHIKLVRGKGYENT